VEEIGRQQCVCKKRYEDLCFALFVIGAVVGLCQLQPSISRFSNNFEMVSIARNLAEHGCFANPEAILDTGPTAANPPLYPLYLSLFIRIFGMTNWVYLAAALSNIVANAFTASFLPRISRLFYGNMWPGVFGSVLWLATMQLLPSWDTSLTVAGVLIFCMFSASYLKTEDRHINALPGGAIAGLLFLLNPASLLITLPLVAYRLIFRKVSFRQTAILLATLFLIIFLWAGRNYLQLGSFVTRTGMGITLYPSNNDCAEPSLVADGLYGCYQAHHPNRSLDEAQLMRSMGEVKYDRKRQADTVLWIKTHPARFYVLTVERIRNFWFPPLNEDTVQAPVIWVITILSIPGLWLMAKHRESVTLFVLSVFIIYPLMYYVVVSNTRYRYPVLWLSLLPAGYFIWKIYLHLHKPSPPSTARI